MGTIISFFIVAFKYKLRLWRPLDYIACYYVAKAFKYKFRHGCVSAGDNPVKLISIKRDKVTGKPGYHVENI